MYHAFSAPVASTRDALAERLQSVHATVISLYNRTKEKLGYDQTTTLRDIVEEEAKQDITGLEDIKHLYGREKETQKISDGIEDIQYLFDGHDMRLIEDGKRVKTWRLPENLN